MAEEKNPDPQLIDPSKTTFISKNTFGSSVHLNRRASIASFHHIRDNPRKWDKNVRRYSTILKPEFSNVSNFIVPHYLRASMGSCHDICKYGRRHSCEEKPKKHPIKITSPSIKQKKEKVFKNHPSVDTKKTSHSLKPFIVSKYYSPKRAPSSGPALQNTVSKCYWPKPKTPSGDKTHNPRQRYVVKKSFVVSKCSSPKQTPPLGATTSFPRQNGPFSNNKTRFSPNSTSRKSFSSSPPEVIKWEILSPVKKVNSPVRGINSNDKKMSRMVRKSKPVSSCKNSDGKTGQKNDVKNGTLSAKNPLVPRVAMLPPKTSVTKKPFLKARKGGALKSSPPTKDRNGRSNGRDSVRKLYVIKSSETKKSPSSLLREKIERRNGNEMDEIVCDKIVSIDIVKVQPVKDDQKYDEIGELQPVKQNQDKNQMGTQNKNAEDSASGGLEKAPVLLSDEKADDKKMIKCSSCYEATDVEIVKVQPVNAESSASLPHEADSKVQPAKENHNKTQRRGKSAISQDKYSPPVKLKFRRGKIIELQNDDNNNFPRRLRFRRSSRIYNDTKDDFAPDNKKLLLSRKSRVVVSEDKYISPTKLMRSSERFVHPHTEDNPPLRLRFGRPRFVVADQNGKNDDFFRRRSFKRSGSKDDLAGCEFSSRRFILKHRNSWQRKEDNRVLFNNVIEETASKLVKSRKSKVKALVGAFETVISLQER